MTETSWEARREAAAKSLHGPRGGAKPAMGAASPSALSERSEYGATSLRQALFALAFLLLLPFVVSLPLMLFRRAADGLWFDFGALGVLTVGAVAILAMLALELLFSVRARLTLAKTALRFTLPAGGGPTPLLNYQSHDIPYHAIRSVELRREVFGGKLTPVLLRGLVIRTKDNREITIGHGLEGFDDPAFPFAEIAAEIARRSAVALIDQRTIWRRSRKERALGFISEFDTQAYILDPAEADRLNLAHRRLILGIASGLATLIILGILAEHASAG